MTENGADDSVYVCVCVNVRVRVRMRVCCVGVC